MEAVQPTAGTTNEYVPSGTPRRKSQANWGPWGARAQRLNPQARATAVPQNTWGHWNPWNP
eukprot:1205837-Pyramimonas_sp.AAC.1